MHLNLLLVQKLESIMVMIMLPECVSVCECMQVCMCDLVCWIKLYPFSLMQPAYNVTWRGKVMIMLPDCLHTIHPKYNKDLLLLLGINVNLKLI